MPERTTRRRLDQPAAPGRRLRVNVDLEGFGRFAERLARFLGTGTYLAWQTVVVVVWIAINLLAAGRGWDPYPFILLNLAFSTQAAYAAPLILLAQNRQDDRDRVALEEDRTRARRTNAETEYLAREIAGLRLAVNEVATRDFVRSELDRRGDRGDRDGRGGPADEESHDALPAAVDRAVTAAVERAVSETLDRSLDQAVARALRRARDEHAVTTGPGESSAGPPAGRR